MKVLAILFLAVAIANANVFQHVEEEVHSLLDNLKGLLMLSNSLINDKLLNSMYSV